MGINREYIQDTAVHYANAWAISGSMFIIRFRSCWIFRFLASTTAMTQSENASPLIVYATFTIHYFPTLFISLTTGICSWNVGSGPTLFRIS